MVSPAKTLPPLQSGDRLSRETFHAIYEARDDIRKAELVKGVVYVPSPARWAQHSEPHSLIDFWLGAYVAEHADLATGVEATLRLSGDTEVQPDGLLFRREGGGVRVSEDGYLEGAPELVVEIAASSAAYDLFDKKDAYRDAGVREYLVWDTHNSLFHWFVLEGDEYRRQDALEGFYESTQFPGLRLDMAAMRDGDRKRIVRALG